MLHLTITDTGVGIAADKLLTLHPFYRADGQGHFPGSGLGLNIARILCQMMGRDRRPTAGSARAPASRSGCP